MVKSLVLCNKTVNNLNIYDFNTTKITVESYLKKLHSHLKQYRGKVPSLKNRT